MQSVEEETAELAAVLAAAALAEPAREGTPESTPASPACASPPSGASSPAVASTASGDGCELSSSRGGGDERPAGTLGHADVNGQRELLRTDTERLTRLVDGSRHDVLEAERAAASTSASADVLELVRLFKIGAAEWTVEQRETLLDRLGTLSFLACAAREALAQVLDSMRLQTYEVGEHVHEQGGASDAFHVIISGRVGLYRRRAAGNEWSIRELAAGDALGELPFVTARPHASSARALEPSAAISIPAAVYSETLAGVAEAAIAERVRELRTSSIFEGVGLAACATLAHLAVRAEAAPGERVHTQHEATERREVGAAPMMTCMRAAP